jgi:hypothetical protein
MSTKSDGLKEKVLKAQSKGDIASLYMLEAEANEILKEQELLAFYANILELAMENLTNGLEQIKRFKLDDVQDYSTLRALYEYALEHYSAKKPNDAAALFEILEGLSDDENFSKAMRIHRLSANNNFSFEEFLEDIADVEKAQNEGIFYISIFSDKAHHLLNIAQVSEGIR